MSSGRSIDAPRVPLWFALSLSRLKKKKKEKDNTGVRWMQSGRGGESNTTYIILWIQFFESEHIQEETLKCTFLWKRITDPWAVLLLRKRVGKPLNYAKPWGGWTPLSPTYKTLWIFSSCITSEENPLRLDPVSSCMPSVGSVCGVCWWLCSWQYSKIDCVVMQQLYPPLNLGSLMRWYI